MRDLIGIAVVLFAATVALTATVFGIAACVSYAINYPACKHFGKLSGLESDYSFGNGCLVKYRGEWVDQSVAAEHKQEVTVK
jgi:hypothetical protein